MSSIIAITHQVKPLTPTTFDQYVEAHRDLAVPRYERAGAELLGVWKWSTGPMGRHLTILRAETGQALFDPAPSPERTGLAGVPDSMQQAGLTISEAVTVAQAVPYSTEDRLRAALSTRGPDDAPRQYMMARLGVAPGGRPLAYELIGELADTFEARGRMRLVLAYQAISRATEELADLWVMDRLGDLGYRPGSPSPLVDRLRSVAPDESIDYLNPLPHSPLR